MSEDTVGRITFGPKVGRITFGPNKLIKFKDYNNKKVLDDLNRSGSNLHTFNSLMNFMGYSLINMDEKDVKETYKMSEEYENGKDLIHRGLEILEMLYNFKNDILDYDEKLYKAMRIIHDGLESIESSENAELV